jgi:hypothetical protein
MFDHVFTQVISALRRSFEEALLQRQAVEERFQVDVFLGDLSFETSYGLPGEQRPARIRVDVSLDWPTWSQTALRSWTIGEEPDELPEVLAEVAFRVQGLAAAPDVGAILAVAPPTLPLVGRDMLERSGPTVEQRAGDDGPEYAIEVDYEGSTTLEEHVLAEPSLVEPALAPLGRMVASVLVRLADLPLEFRPADPTET